MEIAESVKKILQEVIVPELGKIKEENHKIVAMLELTNKRLDDVNTHLSDQSRRIDETNKRIDDVRSDLTQRIDELRSDLTQRIDELRSDLTQRIDEVRSELTQRIDEVRSELTQQMANIHADLIHRLDANNARIDQFFLTSVTKTEYSGLDRRVERLELDVDQLRQRLAA